MPKIVHTADIHLDAHFSYLGKKGNIRRFDLRDCLTRIIDACVEQKADILLIAGDLFEDSRVTPDTINFICGRLKFAGVPVFITPGNHDPYTPDSYYATYEWPSNVHIFKENKFTKASLEKFNLDIYGIANTSHDDKNNYLKDFKVQNPDKINIVLMHGSDLSCVPKGKETYFGFTPADILNCGASYTALGHYHSYKEIASGGGIIAAYPGAPEPLTFADEDAHGFISADISKNNNSINFIPSAKRRIINIGLGVSGAENSEDIFNKVNSVAVNYKNDLIGITLKGQIPAGVRFNADEMTARVEGLFFLKIDNQTRAAYDFDTLAKEKTIRGEFARRMLDNIKRLKEEGDEKHAQVCEHALLYGLDAFELDTIMERL